MVEKITSQRDSFLETEGDRWFLRNLHKKMHNASQDDPVIKAINSLRLEPYKVLEVGCSDGRRLQDIISSSNAECVGIEPSKIAAEEGLKKGLDIRRGTADALPILDERFDLVILGFFLYLVDRYDLFKVAAEIDRVTINGGVVIVYDFNSPIPYRNPYQYQPGLFSFKMNYSDMFKWNPAYTSIYHRVYGHSNRTALPDNVDDQVAISVLRKDMNQAYPDSPFKKRV